MSDLLLGEFRSNSSPQEYYYIVVTHNTKIFLPFGSPLLGMEDSSPERIGEGRKSVKISERSLQKIRRFKEEHGYNTYSQAIDSLVDRVDEQQRIIEILGERQRGFAELVINSVTEGVTNSVTEKVTKNIQDFLRKEMRGITTENIFHGIISYAKSKSFLEESPWSVYYVRAIVKAYFANLQTIDEPTEKQFQAKAQSGTLTRALHKFVEELREAVVEVEDEFHKHLLMITLDFPVLNRLCCEGSLNCDIIAEIFENEQVRRLSKDLLAECQNIVADKGNFTSKDKVALPYIAGRLAEDALLYEYAHRGFEDAKRVAMTLKQKEEVPSPPLGTDTKRQA